MSRILVVDTDRPYLFAFRDIVAQLGPGHEVFCATEFSDAVTIAQHSNLDLVMLQPSLGTGVITGLDLAHALSILDPTLPVMMLDVKLGDSNRPIMHALGLKIMSHPVMKRTLMEGISRYSRGAASAGV
jgi:DNA-binding response OmpR family regulator